MLPMQSRSLLVFLSCPSFWAAIACLNLDFLSYESGYIQNSLLWLILSRKLTTSILFQDPVSLVITAFYPHLRWVLSKITSSDSFLLIVSSWSIRFFLLNRILYPSNNFPMSPILLRNKCQPDSWPIIYFEQQKTCFSMLLKNIFFDVYWQIYCC